MPSDVLKDPKLGMKYAGLGISKSNLDFKDIGCDEGCQKPSCGDSLWFPQEFFQFRIDLILHIPTYIIRSLHSLKVFGRKCW